MYNPKNEPSTSNKVPCSCPKGGMDSEGRICPKCNGLEWVDAPTKQSKGALDHTRCHLIRAIKSIIPPPYLIDFFDIAEEVRKGRTGTIIEIENDKRMKEYEATTERMYSYIQKVKEEAARIALEMKFKPKLDDHEAGKWYTSGYNEACDDIASRIRDNK